MAGKGAVFPTIIILFFLVLVGWTASADVRPAFEVPNQSFRVVAAGDEITIEATAWAGGQADIGFVIFSTQEERQGTGELFAGPIPPDLSSAPLTVTVPRGVLQGDPGVFGKIIGQRVGVAFTTPRLPPEESFGDWEGERDFDSVVQTFPRNVSLGDDGDTPWNAIGLRNLTEFEEIWADRGVSNLSAGTRFDCEPRLPWPCQVTARNGTGNGTIAFARLVEDGQTFLVDSFLGDRETAGGFSGSMRIADSAGGRFELRMEPDVGIMFQFREGFPPGIPPGTYRTVSIGDGVFTADYSPQAAVQPELIGRWSWYDIVVVSIGNDDAASAAG